MTLLDYVTLAVLAMFFAALLLATALAFRDFCRALGRPRK